MIHLLDRNDQIVDVLVNPSQDKVYWDTKITEDVDNSLLTLDFTTLSTLSFDEVFKITAQDQDGNHRLFLISNVEKNHDANGLTQTIQADGDHVLLGLEKPIEPITLTGTTLEEVGKFILQGLTYQLGQVDFMGIDDVVFTEYISPLAALQQIKDQFKCALKFRVEIVGKTITRFVDLLQPLDEFSGKELVFGKDIEGIKRSEDTSKVITRMVGEAFDSDGNLVTFASVNGGRNFVESPESFARWNINGRHRYGIHQYQPEDGGDIDPEKMLKATRESFELTNDSIVSYEVTDVALEQTPGYEHEKIRVYMNVRIKDEGYEPVLYLTAQVKQTEMPELDDKSGNFTYQFGDYNVIKVKINQQIRDLQSQLLRRAPVWDASGAKADAANQLAGDAQQAASDAKQSADNATQQVVTLGKAVDGKSTIVASSTEPSDTTAFWIDTSETLNVLKHFDTATGQWVKASATDFIDLGGQVVGDQIAPKAVTFDKISVMELSAIVANLGEVNAGILNGVTINGATLQSIIDAKNFLQIVGNHLHSESQTDDSEVDEYSVFDVNNGSLLLEFGFIDHTVSEQRIPTGQMFVRDHEIVFAENEDEGAGVVITPASATLSFGTDALGANRVSLHADGAINGNGKGALDLYVDMAQGGVMRLRTSSATSYLPGSIECETVFASVQEGNPESATMHVYMRPKPGGIALITQAGTTNVLMEIRAARFTTSSHKKFKANIEAWTDSVWDAIKSTGLYSYNLKDDLSQGINFKHYGVIFGDGYGAPSMVSLPDGEHLDEHNYTSLTLKGVQELMYKVDDQSKIIKDLQTRLEALEGQI